MNLRLHPLDQRRLLDFERLLSGKEFGGCYCAVWRHGDDPDAWQERCLNKPHENLEETRARVKAGGHVGFLVSREMDGTVVAWTGSGPKTAFAGGQWWPGSRMGPQDDSVWVIGCLAIGFEHRSRGYSREIVELVLEEAKRAGAAAVEAFPTDPADEDSAWCGTRKLFEEAGFQVAEESAMGEKKVLRMEKKLT